MASPLATRFWVIAAVILVAIAAAYADALAVPPVFDDVAVLGGIATPGSTVSGRPLLQASFAAQRNASAPALHLVNLAIHGAAALTLLALLIGMGLPIEIAGLAAGLWALHPLQTEAVTYLAQRAESLAGLFILLALACLVWRRYPASVLAGVAGLAVKETAIVVPLLAWVLDRWALRRSAPRWYFPVLFATWPLATAYYLWDQGRATTAGFHTAVSVGAYVRTQVWAIPHYLRLALWPRPLVFDYGTWIEPTFPWASAAALLAVVATLLWVFRRNRWAGFGLLAFFACLAPSSSVVPVATQTVAEHRMYLALAPLAVLAAWGIARLGRQAFLVSAVVLGCGLVILTASRNHDYRSAAALWADTARHWPANARAWLNLGAAELAQGDADAALEPLRNAIERQADYPEAYRDLGDAELKLGRVAKAIEPLRTAVAQRPGFGDAWFDLGVAYQRLDENGAAAAAFATAETLNPADPAPHVNRASALSHRGDSAGALAEYTEAIRLEPHNADTRFNRGNAYARAGRWDLAAADYRTALAIDPDIPDAHANLAVAEEQLAGAAHSAPQSTGSILPAAGVSAPGHSQP